MLKVSARADEPAGQSSQPSFVQELWHELDSQREPHIDKHTPVKKLRATNPQGLQKYLPGFDDCTMPLSH
jgi:hypothetical protein